MKLPFVCIALSFFMFMTSCNDDKKSKKENNTIYKEKKETPKQTQETTDVPVMLDNKGIGPIESLTFDDDVDQELASRGAQIFNAKCTACHKADQKFIGPSMAGIYKRRSPEWVMNIILNPDEMLEKDPVAKALLKAYNNTVMLNQNIQEEEARAMAEWFRTLE
ncbi:MAG: cytochrome c [Bacteroidota bacterium]